jgi:hypothetical protein
MAKLIYSATASLDGYVEGAQGNFDCAAPDEGVHALVNELERPIGTYLYGRRMYETILYWETVSSAAIDRRPAGISPSSGGRPRRSVFFRAPKTVSSETATGT